MRILLIRFSSLGDVVMVTALAAAIKKQLPDAEISVLTKEEYAGVFAGSKDVSVVSPLKSGKRSFLDLCALGESLEKKFDLILDLHANPRSFIVSVLASAKTVKYRKHMLKRRRLQGRGELEMRAAHDDAGSGGRIILGRWHGDGV